MIALTREAAEEVGRSFRFARHAREMTLREAARAAGISTQYTMDIEKGTKNVSEEILYKLWLAYRLDSVALDNVLLRARVLSALQKRGLNDDQVKIVWRAMESRLEDVGIDVRADAKEAISALYAG